MIEQTLSEVSSKKHLGYLPSVSMHHLSLILLAPRSLSLSLSYIYMRMPAGLCEKVCLTKPDIELITRRRIHETLVMVNLICVNLTVSGI